MPEQDAADTRPGEMPDNDNLLSDVPQPAEEELQNAGQSDQVAASDGEQAQPEQVEAQEVEQPVEAAAGDDVSPQPEPVELQDPAPEPRRLSRAEREIFDRQQRRFAACGRCSYFVADCRVFLGQEAFQTAVLDTADDWLRLEGDETFRRLISNAYGIEVDVGYDYLDGSCPECRRRFVYAEQADGPTRLKIHV